MGCWVIPLLRFDGVVGGGEVDLLGGGEVDLLGGGIVDLLGGEVDSKHDLRRSIESVTCLSFTTAFKFLNYDLQLHTGLHITVRAVFLFDLCVKKRTCSLCTKHFCLVWCDRNWVN